MTSPHTEGRLTVNEIDPLSLYCGAKSICRMDQYSGAEGRANAQRLAAAWNACLSVPLDVLERIDVGRLRGAAQFLLERMAEEGIDTRRIDSTIRGLRAALGDDR